MIILLVAAWADILFYSLAVNPSHSVQLFANWLRCLYHAALLLIFVHYVAYICEAIRLWRPLYEQTEGEALDAMKAAIAESLSTILYIPVELAARQWDSYYDERTACTLADTISTLLRYEAGYAAQADDYSTWICELFRANYVFLVDEAIGINKPVPVGTERRVEAYGEALQVILKMAERIPGNDGSDAAVKENASQKLKRFIALNHTAKES